jgi:hypothetical protein
MLQLTQQLIKLITDSGPILHQSVTFCSELLITPLQLDTLSQQLINKFFQSRNRFQGHLKLPL